jgi:threonine/homoserine/homoserine lactone efflux protein
MPTGRSSDVIALIERAAELVVRLVSARLELAAAQLRTSAVRTGRRAAYAFAAGLALALALALVAAALVDALASLITSRPARLLLVSAPFFVVAYWAASHGVRPATDEPDGERDHGEDEQDVDPGSDGVTTDEAE